MTTIFICARGIRIIMISITSPRTLNTISTCSVLGDMLGYLQYDLSVYGIIDHIRIMPQIYTHIIMFPW